MQPVSIIGSDAHWVSVGAGVASPSVRQFGCFTVWFQPWQRKIRRCWITDPPCEMYPKGYQSRNSF